MRGLVVWVAFLAFVSLGLPDAVLGVAWPTMRAGFGKPLSYMGGVLLCGTAGYLVASLSTAAVVARLGTGRLLLVSTVMVTGALMLYATAPVYAVVCGAAVMMGLGSGAIDACLNSYSAERFSPALVSYLHGFYGVGATIGPAIMTVAVTHATWRLGYGSLAVGTGVMAVMFLVTLRAWDAPPASEGARKGDAAPPPPATMGVALRSGQVWAGMGLYFLYTGLEVAAGQWLYSLLTEQRGRPAGASGLAVTAYWASFTVGRFVLGALTVRVPAHTVVRGALLLAPVPIGVLILGVSPVADYVSAAVLGALLAPVYPLLMSMTPGYVGAGLSSRAVALQVSAATFGVAVHPALAGVVARSVSLEAVPWFLLGLAVAQLGVFEVTRRTRPGEVSSGAGVG